MLSEKIKTILYANFDCRCLIRNEKGEFEGFDLVSKVADQIISALATTTEDEKELTDAYGTYVAYGTYLKLLEDELNEVVPLAHTHGWKSSRFESGEKCRQNIQKSRAIFAAKLAQAEQEKQQAVEAERERIIRELVGWMKQESERHYKQPLGKSFEAVLVHYLSHRDIFGQSLNGEK